MFYKQFIGTRTWQILIGIVAVHVLAILVKDTAFELPALIVLGLATFWLSWKDLSTGLLVAFVEIFVGGHGHLIDAEVGGFSISIRMAIFGAVMGVWLIRFLKQDVKPQYVAFRDAPWIMLTLAVLLGSLIGFLQNDPAEAFDDMNGFLTIAYLLPLISFDWTQERKRELLQALFASALWLALFTLALSYAFNHVDGKALNHVYRFVRDQRLAEVTLQVLDNGAGYWYRIFMQSHFFALIMLFLAWSGMLVLWRDQRLPEWVAALFSVLGATLLLSMSRSFFMGGALACIWIIGLSLTVGKKAVINVARRLIYTVVLALVAFGIAGATAMVPLPAKPDISDAAFYQTSADTDRDVALSSRWELLGPLMEAIWHNPIAGAGFGANVTYITDDPRIRAMNPGGEYTTYRFEWGYQDLWLKMGIFGLLAFGWYFVAMMQAMHYTHKQHGQKWLMIGLSAGMIMLAVAHVFSPYLNHPIGIAYMLFVLPFIDFGAFRKQEAKEPELLTRLEFAQPARQMAGVVQIKEET